LLLYSSQRSELARSRTSQKAVQGLLSGPAAPVLHAQAGQALREPLHQDRRRRQPRLSVVQEPQVHQAGEPMKIAEVGKHRSVVAGRLQREAAQRREPAATTNVLRSASRYDAMAVPA